MDMTSFHSYLESLNLQLKRLLGNLMDQEMDAEFWMAALQAGIVVTASDGSVKHRRGTYTVIFKAGDSEL
eukprot:4622246-Ditylum_brightwellii.AAC.1